MNVSILGQRPKLSHIHPRLLTVAGSLIRVDDHVIPLSNAQEDPIGVVWLDGDEIGSDDLKRVIVQGHHEVVVN